MERELEKPEYNLQVPLGNVRIRGDAVKMAREQ